MYLVLALGVAVLAAVAVLVLLSQGEPNDRDEFDLSIPTLPADTCSAEQFISFLGESSGGELTARGEAVCSGNYAAVPTQRASAGGTGSLVSAFRSGPEALWEHFATLDAAECPDLVVIDPGFPAEICTQLR